MILQITLKNMLAGNALNWSITVLDNRHRFCLIDHGLWELEENSPREKVLVSGIRAFQEHFPRCEITELWLDLDRLDPLILDTLLELKPK